jgi:hypothetical protein
MSTPAEELLLFETGISTKPLNLTLWLKICVHFASTSSVPFRQKHVAPFSREIMPPVQGEQSPEAEVE